MAVKLRLSRTGGKNDVCYRVVATDSRTRRDGPVLETLGWYDPKKPSDRSRLNIDRVRHWLDQGAQPSDTVRSLIGRARAKIEKSIQAESEAQIAES